MGYIFCKFVFLNNISVNFLEIKNEIFFNDLESLLLILQSLSHFFSIIKSFRYFGLRKRLIRFSNLKVFNLFFFKFKMDFLIKRELIELSFSFFLFDKRTFNFSTFVLLWDKIKNLFFKKVAFFILIFSFFLKILWKQRFLN